MVRAGVGWRVWEIEMMKWQQDRYDLQIPDLFCGESADPDFCHPIADQGSLEYLPEALKFYIEFTKTRR